MSIHTQHVHAQRHTYKRREGQQGVLAYAHNAEGRTKCWCECACSLDGGHVRNHCEATGTTIQNHCHNQNGNIMIPLKLRICSLAERARDMHVNQWTGWHLHGSQRILVMPPTRKERECPPLAHREQLDRTRRQQCNVPIFMDQADAETTRRERAATNFMVDKLIGWL